ncbi:Hypp8548 [Branchiostoma lanceolatum]|uniref:Hypp8548 protein n=1 Tax=Branchiostoma lanceolatum TaxID=7740 RepID=A0A8K0EHM5_BRALA|nr:Hypp8548 [Branchiostoma lanceolatum]
MVISRSLIRTYCRCSMDTSIVLRGKTTRSLLAQTTDDCLPFVWRKVPCHTSRLATDRVAFICIPIGRARGRRSALDLAVTFRVSQAVAVSYLPRQRSEKASYRPGLPHIATNTTAGAIHREA